MTDLAPTGLVLLTCWSLSLWTNRGPLMPPSHPALYSGGSLIDLGSFGGSGNAYAINGLGQVAGVSQTAAGADHAFLYTGGVLHDLGTLGGTDSNTYGINSLGQIVGTSDEIPNSAGKGFLYSNGQMTDLNNLLDSSGAGWTVTGAFAINDAGWIAATARDSDGFEHAVLLAPDHVSTSC